MSKIEELATTAEFRGKDRKSFEEGFVQGGSLVLSVLYKAAYEEDWITNPQEGVKRFFEIYKQYKP